MEISVTPFSCQIMKFWTDTKWIYVKCLIVCYEVLTKYPNYILLFILERLCDRYQKCQPMIKGEATDANKDDADLTLAQPHSLAEFWRLKGEYDSMYWASKKKD